MASSRVDGDLYVAGSLGATSMTIASGSVTNAAVASGAAIAAEKIETVVSPGTDGGLGYAGTFAAKHVVVFVAPAACTIREFHAVQVGANTTGTSGFDLNVNGTTALSGHVTFTSSDSAGAVKDGTLSTTTLAADDIVSIEFTVDVATPDGTGPFAWCLIDFVAP